MQKQLQPAIDRFKAVQDDDQRSAFRDRLNAFIKVYCFLGQIIPYADSHLEMFYSYGRFLLPHLPLDRDPGPVKLADEVGLQYYRMQRMFQGSIDLYDGEGGDVKSPTETGSGKVRDVKAPLSEIIEVLNDRFGTSFTEEDRLFFEQIKEKAVNTPEVIRLRQANPFDKFQLGLRQMLEDFMIRRMGENDRIVTRYMDDKAFENAAFAVLSRVIYDSIPEIEKSD